MSMATNGEAIARGDGSATPAPLVAAPVDARGRIRHIEVIRGIACLMVVAYHVIGNDPAHGMKMPAGSAWWVVPRVLDLVQMPLFAFVSGWVFSIPTAETGRFGGALGRKLLRLALPMVSVSLLYFAIDTARGRTEGIGVVDVLITPYQHLWYLQASLWLVLVASLGLLAARGRETPVVAGLLALSVVPFLAAPRFAFDLLAAEQAIYLAPFFLAGLLANRIGVEREARASGTRLAATLGGLTAVCGGMAIVTWFLVSTTPAEDMPTHTVPALLLGVAFALLLMLTRPQSRLLENLGERSLTIYLFHVFFAAPAREALLKVWPAVPGGVLFVVAFTVGVVVPWVLHDGIRRFRWSSVLFLGDSPFGGRR